jgi:hypothetical protein
MCQNGRCTMYYRALERPSPPRTCDLLWHWGDPNGPHVLRQVCPPAHYGSFDECISLLWSNDLAAGAGLSGPNRGIMSLFWTIHALKGIFDRHCVPHEPCKGSHRLRLLAAVLLVLKSRARGFNLMKCARTAVARCLQISHGTVKRLTDTRISISWASKNACPRELDSH